MIQSWLHKLQAWWVDDETPWCGVFVAACMDTIGFKLPKFWMRAKSWAEWGTRLTAPAPGCIVVFERQGRTLMASTNLRENAITVIDMGDWKKIASIPTRGPGFFLRSHENSRYAWADSMMSPSAKDTLYVIDKQTLQVVK